MLKNIFGVRMGYEAKVRRYFHRRIIFFWLRGCIQRKTWGPYAGVDFDLTLSHSRLQSHVGEFIDPLRVS